MIVAGRTGKRAPRPAPAASARARLDPPLRGRRRPPAPATRKLMGAVRGVTRDGHHRVAPALWRRDRLMAGKRGLLESGTRVAWAIMARTENTVLDQLSGRRRGSNSDRAAWIINALRRASGTPAKAGGAPDRCSRLELSNNLLRWAQLKKIPSPHRPYFRK
jgi:hypothetical protein